MTNVADAAPVPGQVEPPARPSIRGMLAQTEIDLRLFGMVLALGVILLVLPRRERREADPAEQHDHAGRPGLRHRDHRDRDGADHRLAQHRPVGRVARRRRRDELRAAHDATGSRTSSGSARTRRSCGRSPWRSASASGPRSGRSRDSSSPTSACRRSSSRSGGLLTIRGLIWYQSQGAAVNGLDSTFLLIGGGAQGSLGEMLTWALALVGCLAIVAIIVNGRRQRRRYGFPVRPMWAEIALVRGRLRRHPGHRLVRQQQLLAAGPRRADRPRAGLGAGTGGWLADPDRVPLPDRPAHRRDAGDDVDGHPAAVRSVRLRLRRQSRRRRAGRHQHPPDDPQDVRR